jgi:hypothetical protein
MLADLSIEAALAQLKWQESRSIGALAQNGGL